MHGDELTGKVAIKDNDNAGGDVFLKTGMGKSAEIAALLEQRIRQGDYPIGSQLPSERKLAAGFHVSRNTLRDAIAILAEKNHVATRWGAGTIVLGADETTKAIEAKFSEVLPEWDNIIELRNMVEPHVAALAARKAGASDLLTLSTILERSTPRMQPRESLKMDMEFHLAIAKSTGNPLVAALLEFVNEATEETRGKTHETVARRKLSIDGHTRIFDCIRKGDVQGAEEAMRRHLQEVGAVKKTVDDKGATKTDETAQKSEQDEA
ncbi:GntR family transcriptional regulator [Bifidobacterium subtile]|uniref:GntR family transcriptional regulator n=1 Tax=Bifidobacterium subtile TaxID=77635 RepID=A0A087EA72_9BIFI|nr:GntR family transcriptional regulator [Bifidobacterium subtile]